ncbi:hypothetical protein HHK36_015124 [Tetracentron sinense]|uniref:non-specific serine/threonine protein kinase n=1 Tax=Tetracentron sinense TaxID=13715 RepID=A0A835DGF5_TETSI|nr:hypothetical protein HHK36_015124 [Tetracentron sinense]
MAAASPARNSSTVPPASTTSPPPPSSPSPSDPSTSPPSQPIANPPEPTTPSTPSPPPQSPPAVPATSPPVPLSPLPPPQHPLPTPTPQNAPPVLASPPSPPRAPPPDVAAPPPPVISPPNGGSPPRVSPLPPAASPPPPEEVTSSPPPPANATPPLPSNSPPPPSAKSLENSPPPPPQAVSRTSPPANVAPPLPSNSPPQTSANPPKNSPPPSRLAPPNSSGSQPAPPSRTFPPPHSPQSLPPPDLLPSSPYPPSSPFPPNINSSGGGSPQIPNPPHSSFPLTNPSPNVPKNAKSPGSGGIKTGGAVAIGVIVSFVVLSLIAMVVWCMRKQKRKISGYNGGYVMPSSLCSSQKSDSSLIKTHSSAPLIGSGSFNDFIYSPSEPGVLGNSRSWFTYNDLVEVTNGFSEQNFLGEGGFGSVHKGSLPDGREVAVKQLKIGGAQGDREFRAEVEIISRVHHRHLVSLVGYCIFEHQRLLVYDYVPNNNLYYHLHEEGRPVMDWATRVKVAAGAARGIAYLHEDCHPRIIHRDIKSSNILLDNNFEALVSDFGLAKLALDAYTHVTTRVMGTFGYMAPEYASSGKLTEKSDVYSFGVVLLELITGRKPVDASQPLGDESLVEWARPLLSHALDNQDFEGLADPRLNKNVVESEMFRMIEAAAACVRHSALKRPRMGQVVRTLDCIGDSTDLTNGMKPGHSGVFDSAQESAEIRMFRRMAFDLRALIGEEDMNGLENAIVTQMEDLDSLCSSAFRGGHSVFHTSFIDPHGIVIFVFLRLPHKLARKSKKLAKRKFGKRRRENNMMKRAEDQYRDDQMKIHVGGVPLNAYHGYECPIEEIEKVLGELSQQGGFAFGSYWGREESGSFPKKDIVKQELDYSFVHYHFIVND